MYSGAYGTGSGSRLKPTRISPHIVLQNDSGADFVHQLLVLPRLPAQSAVDHGLMGQDRRETLVIIVHRHLRHLLATPGNELPHTLQILARPSVGLTRFTDNDALNLLTGDIVLQERHQSGRRNSRQPSRDNLERVGDCKSCAFLAVVNRKYPGHASVNISSPINGR